MDSQWFICTLPSKLVSVMQYGLDKHTRAMFIFSSPPFNFDKRDRDAQKAIIKEAMKGDIEYWAVEPLLGALDGADDLYFDEVTQIHMPTWMTAEFACLVTPATRPPCSRVKAPVSPSSAPTCWQGNSSALTVTPSVAFPKYESAMRDYAELNQKARLRCRGIQHSDELGGHRAARTPRC